MTKKDSKKTFAQAMEELEDIVQKMEEGDLSLEEMLEQYAQGILLLKDCKNRLAAAEKQMEKLSTDLEEPGND